MSDVIVSTTESTTNVTTVNDVTTIAITNNVVEVSQATAGLQGPPGANSDPTYVFVTNKTGSTLAKGSIVYVSGANGVHTQVSLALAVGDITSARTLGWLSENIANNATGLCCVEGYLDGVNTQGITEGAQLYLSPTIPGAFTETKPTAADHLVYVGVCAKASAGNGRVFVKVQNGYELNELHDVKTVNLANNDLLRYSASTALWENVAATAITVGSAITSGTSVYATNAGTSVYASTSGTSVYATNAGTAVDLSGSITKSQVSDFTSGTVASASTAQQAGTAVYATTSGSASVSGSAVAYTGSITISQITDLANATVTSASTAQQAGTSVYASTAGTSVYADTSGTATYATTSGTAVSISGTITRSQVSDYASGTVANISGTVAQSQVSNLVTDLAGKAGLADNNTFTGTNTFSNFTTFQAAADAIPIRVFGANGQSADLFSVNDYLTNTQFEILSDGRAQSLKGIIATVSSTASTPLVVRGTAGQSANLMQVETSSATAISVTSAGNLNVVGQARVGTTSGLGQLSVVSTGTATIAAVIRGASGQSTDYFSIQNSGGTALARMNLNGSFFFGTTTANYPTFFGSSGSLAGMINVVPASTAVIPIIVRGAASQSANLQEWQISTGGTVARVDKNGAVSAQYFGPSGAGLLGYLDWTTNSPIFNTGGTAVIGITVRGASGQSADLQAWQSSATATLASISSSGSFFTNSTLFTTLQTYIYGAGDYGAALNVVTRSTANAGVIVRGRASQATALQQWQNSGGTTTSQISADGTLFASRFAYFGSVQTAGLSNAVVSVVPTSATNIPVAIRGAASQSADLLQIQNSSGGTVTRVDSNGAIASGNTILGQITSIPASTATKGLVIRGASGQSANLFEIQNSTPTTLVSVGNDGAITHNAFYQNFNNMLTSGRMAIGTSSLPSGVQLGVYSGGTANKGLVVQGIASQSANLQEWQNSGSTVIARVSSAGLIRSADNIQANALVGVTASSDITNTTSLARIQANSTLGGGWFQAVKLNAATSNIAVDSAQIYFRDGTNANTLKLVVKAGAGAEQTILDNIPTA